MHRSVSTARVPSRVGAIQFAIGAVATLMAQAAAAAPPNPTGSDSRGNTAGGYRVLANVSSAAEDNTGFGFRALNDNAGGLSNTATGSYALTFNLGGSYNSAAGYSALAYNTSGSYNAAMGGYALFSNTTGGYNTASGASSLSDNTTGRSNTATGYQALFSNTTASFNTATGSNALYGNTTGSANTAMGASALQHTSTGTDNAGFGQSALKYNTNGHDNTALGRSALLNNTTGDDNVAVGSSAGKNLRTGSANIYLGSAGGSASESRVMRLGSGQTQTYVAGIAGVPLAGAAVVVTASGRLGVVASSTRYKDDVRDLADQSGQLRRLRPVSYRYKADPAATRQYGLIAEEVATVYPELVVRGPGGRVESLQYHQLIALLLQQSQQQQRRIDALEALNATMQARLERVEAGAATSAQLAGR